MISSNYIKSALKWGRLNRIGAQVFSRACEETISRRLRSIRGSVKPESSVATSDVGEDAMQQAREPINIVYIDPSRAYQRLMRMALTETGMAHGLRAFPSVIGALDSLASPKSPRVDLVVVNVSLPMLEIQEAVASLRRLPPLAAARFAITIIDAYDRPRVPPGCIPLMKPVDSGQLRALLQPLAAKQKAAS
jgi:hypothetical protein